MAEDQRIIDRPNEYVAGYVIEFTDGGDPEGNVLHRGTKADCENIRDNMCHAVSYSGNRPVKGAKFFIVPAVIYDTFQEGGGTA